MPHRLRRPPRRPAAGRRSAGRRPRRGQVRIKDIADVEGVRENQLVGYGLVVGLNGTGDRLDNAVFTRESLIGMLERLGVNTRDQVSKLQTKNVAAVMVTAEPAGLRAHRQPHRRRGFRARRCQGPDRRHPAGDSAAGRRRRGLCGRPGRAGDRRDRRARRRRLRSPAACRPPAASPTAPPSSARSATSSAAHPALRLGLRNPDLTTARRIARRRSTTRSATASPAPPIRAPSRSNLGGRDVIEVARPHRGICASSPTAPPWW